MKNHSRKILLLLIALLLPALCSCSSKEDELYALYSKPDNVVNTDVGEYIIGQTAPLFTEGKYCFVKTTDYSSDAKIKNKAALVINISDNKLVYANDCFEKVYPASVTKLMTALVILKYGNIDDKYEVKEDNCGITEEGAQLMGFKKGDVLTVRDLLYCLLLYSGNDAAEALADYYSGSNSEFCKIMNEEAEKLGCIGTHYTNPHGLHDEDHYTTAYDEYVILSKCLEYELFRDITQCSTVEISYLNAEGQPQTMSVVTTNSFKLGEYAVPEGMTIIGGKTGNTYAAGACLIQAVKTSDGKEYIIGFFGAENNDYLYEQMSYEMNKLQEAAGGPEKDKNVNENKEESSDKTENNDNNNDDSSSESENDDYEEDDYEEEDEYSDDYEEDDEEEYDYDEDDE